MGPVSKAKMVKLPKSPKSSIISKPKPKTIVKKAKVKTKHISSQPGVKKIVKVKKRSFDPIKANRGVVFLKHIPHGFYEEQMRKYFEQFGAVTRLHLARSERTGRSKGYAFIEFKVPEVAKIAAETMDNYIMFKHVLKAAYIPPAEQNVNYFREDVRFITDSQGVRTFTSSKIERINQQVENINRVKTDEEHTNKIELAKYKLKKQGEKYGVDLSSCLYSGGSSTGEKDSSSGEKQTSSGEKQTSSGEKQTKKVAKKKKIPSTGKPLPLNTKIVDVVTDSSDEKVTNSGQKQVKKVEKKKKILSTDDSKSLLLKLANETFDESDSSDEDFKIDYEFSASGDESDTEPKSLEDLLRFKLSHTNKQIAAKSNDDKKSSAFDVTVVNVPKSQTEKKTLTTRKLNSKGHMKSNAPDAVFVTTKVSESEAETKKIKTKKGINLKLTGQPNISKETTSSTEITSGSEYQSVPPKVNVKKRKHKAKESTNVLTSSSEPEVAKKGNNANAKKIKVTSAQDFELTVDVRKKPKIKSKSTASTSKKAEKSNGIPFTDTPFGSDDGEKVKPKNFEKSKLKSGGIQKKVVKVQKKGAKLGAKTVKKIKDTPMTLLSHTTLKRNKPKK